jgi:VWFA-related protein
MAKAVVCASLIVLLWALAAAQQPPAPKAAEPEPFDQSTLIRVDVDLVNILATVRGRNNALIGNLEQKDFRLFEDGKEQQIKYFTRETDLPLTIGLLVDTSGSMANLIEVERRAAAEFFRKVLRPQDLAFLISFGKDSELLQDSTNSVKLLEDGLAELRLNASVGGIQPGPVPTLQNRAGTVLYDAIFLAAEERLRQEVGRKVIVVITDGVDVGSKVSRAQAIEAAQKADAVIYSIYYSDRYFGGSDGDIKRMSEETGGRVMKIERNHTLDDIFREIQEEMRSQYAIAYSPTNAVKDGSYRRIEFKMSNRDYKVQARKGYYAIAGEF